jgi:hypothetical protein
MPKQQQIFCFDVALKAGGGAGRFRFEPVGGGTKIKAVWLICPRAGRAGAREHAKALMREAGRDVYDGLEIGVDVIRNS